MVSRQKGREDERATERRREKKKKEKERNSPLKFDAPRGWDTRALVPRENLYPREILPGLQRDIRLEKRMRRPIRRTGGRDCYGTGTGVRIRMSYFSLHVGSFMHSASELAFSIAHGKDFRRIMGASLVSSAAYGGLLLGFGARGNSDDHNGSANLPVWPSRLS